MFLGSHISTFGDHCYTEAVRHVGAWMEGRTSKLGVLEDATTVVPGAAKPIAPKGASGSDAATVPRSTGGRDLLEAARGVGMGVLLRFGYGQDPESKRSKELSLAVATYGKGVAMQVKGLMGIAGLCCQMTEKVSVIRRITDEMVSERKQLLEKIQSGASKETPPVDFISQLIETDLSPFEVAAEVNHLYGAHKAAPFVMVGVFFQLSRPENKVWLDRLRDEWRTVLGPRRK